jgi:hypothetical protein
VLDDYDYDYHFNEHDYDNHYHHYHDHNVRWLVALAVATLLGCKEPAFNSGLAPCGATTCPTSTSSTLPN